MARNWGNLSASYRKRLERAGVTREQYESGASLRQARGHAQTPEHPQDAYRAVSKYRAYLDRLADLQERVIERKIRIFGNAFKFNQERSEQYVMQGGADVPMPSRIELQRMLDMTDDEIEELLHDPHIDEEWRFLWYH